MTHAPGSSRWRPDKLSRTWPALAGVVLVLLTLVIVSHPGPLPGEIAYIRWLQRRGEPLRTLAEVVRATTGTEGNLVVAVPAGIWLIHRHRSVGVRALSIVLVTLLVIQPVFKELVDRPRPAADQVEVRATHTSKSFPSGHSLSTTTVWGAACGLAWQRRRRSLAVGLAIPIVMTGVASGVQGVHWPTDALAGTLVGGLAAWAIVRVLNAGPGGDRRYSFGAIASPGSGPSG